MKIKRYKLFLESQGTPELVDDIVKNNIDKITMSAKNNKDILLKINKSDLVANVIIRFITAERYNGAINYKECIDSSFNKCDINIYYPIIYDIDNIIKTISHELTHLYELYQIKDIFNDTKWKWQDALINTKLQDKISKNIEYFRDILYLSLPHELNARVSSLYRYLLMKSDKNKENIINNLEQTKEWDNYLNLINFSPNKLISSLTITFKDDYDFLFFILNELNSNLGIKYKIDNMNDVEKYFNKFDKALKKQAEKYKSKLLRVVNRVYKILNEELYYTTHHPYPDNVVLEQYLEITKIDLRDKKIKSTLEYNNYIKELSEK